MPTVVSRSTMRQRASTVSPVSASARAQEARARPIKVGRAVDGFVVGRASLDAADFLKICTCRLPVPQKAVGA